MKLTLSTAVTLLALCGSARATDVLVRITDQNGDPAVNAVIVLSNDNTAAGTALPGQLETNQLIDQRDETFIPHITVIPRNGEVRFANSDAPLHQVYSFSPIKRFELTLDPGETSPRILFDQAGVAAIGCNIHDHMITYIFVTSSPTRTGKRLSRIYLQALIIPRFGIRGFPPRPKRPKVKLLLPKRTWALKPALPYCPTAMITARMGAATSGKDHGLSPTPCSFSGRDSSWGSSPHGYPRL